MNFKEKFQAVLKSLGFVDKAKSGELTKEDWDKIAANFKETHGKDFYAAMQEDEAAAKDAEEANKKAAAHDKALQILNDSTKSADGNGSDSHQAETPNEDATLEQRVSGLATKVNGLEKENKTLKDALNKREPENVEEVKIDIAITGVGRTHSDTHLFGVNHGIYAINRRYNQMFLNPGNIHTMGAATREDESAFHADFGNFASQVASAVRALHANKQLNAELLRSSSNPDLTALTNAGLGDQFVQFRVRELIARVLTIPNPFGIFPRRSGVQDRELITNAFVGALTQAWQDSETSLKGSSSLEPEMGYVDDAMILSKFGSFKDIERKYIAYLNTDGSDPVKWGMIEYFLMLYMMQATKEMYERVVMGIYVKPEADSPGHHLYAATGVINRAIFYAIEKKLRVLVDASLATYDNTGTVFIDAVIEMAAWAIDNLAPLGINVENDLTLMLNANHKRWFRSGYRSKYNLHGDFDGIEDMKVPDTELKITWVPNMGQTKMMLLTQPGNFQCLENVPGEMFSFYLERRLNNVYVQSVWKEGTSAAYAGKKAANLTELNAREWDKQLIWFPKPYADLAAGATAADAANGFWFRTIANAGATNITGITSKKEGQMYIIECNSLTNASTVNKTGDFSEITANFVPTAVGDLLVVVWDSSADSGNGKYKEICRVVGGVLTYNPAVAPNAIGAR